MALAPVNHKFIRNVKDYVAVADSVTDGSEALDKAPSGGGCDDTCGQTTTLETEGVSDC